MKHGIKSTKKRKMKEDDDNLGTWMTFTMGKSNTSLVFKQNKICSTTFLSNITLFIELFTLCGQTNQTNHFAREDNAKS